MDELHATIRILEKDELPLCMAGAGAFHNEYKLPGRFDPECYLKNWTTFYERYDAAVIGLWKEEALIGGLGCLIVPDLSDGRLCANEMFIFIHPEHRGGTGFFRLLRSYKSWADKQQCAEARIVHMDIGENGDGLKRIYGKMGAILTETCYRIPLTDAAHHVHANVKTELVGVAG